MTSILNPGFETAGALPGQAEHWTLTAYTSRERIAGFGPGHLLGWEGFERWHELLRELEDAQTVRAFFDPHAEGYEDFEEAWDNDVYLWEAPTGHLAAALFHGGETEDLEAEWDNVPFARTWGAVAEAPAAFHGEPVESCGHGWHANEQYIWDWAGVTEDAARFDGGSASEEHFSGAWAAATTI